MVEVLVEELGVKLEQFILNRAIASLTSFAGLAISLNGTGIPDMMAERDGIERNLMRLRKEDERV